MRPPLSPWSKGPNELVRLSVGDDWSAFSVTIDFAEEGILATGSEDPEADPLDADFP